MKIPYDNISSFILYALKKLKLKCLHTKVLN